MKKFVGILSGVVMFVGVIAQLLLQTNVITAENLPIEPNTVALAGIIGIFSMVLVFAAKTAVITVWSFIKPIFAPAA